MIGSIGVLLPTMNDNASTNSSTPTPFDPISWELANPWLSGGQRDDRTPMNGSVGDCDGPPTVRRAFARRSHQLMFKKWSQARHD